VYNIHDFYDKYLSRRAVEEQLERIIVLEENYRSTPIILESSRILIENNSERITHLIEGKTIAKRLQAAHSSLKFSNEPISFIDVSLKEDLPIPIVLEIEKLIQNGVSFKDIAVLFPSNQQSIDFSDYLKILAYPFELSKEEDLLQDAIILSYLQVFHLIQLFQQNKNIDKSIVGDILIQPWMEIPLTDIAQFWAEIKEIEPENFLDYIQNYDVKESIKTIFSILDNCIKMQSLLPPQRFFHYVLDSFRIKEWALNQHNRLDILQKIEALDRFLTDYIYANENKKIGDFLERIHAYQREKIAISYIKHIQSEDSIKLMTYHKSKGLEFDYVFVYGAGRFTLNNQNKIYMPELVLEKDIHAENESKVAEEEKRRLLYVAMTRAKKKLILIDVLEENADGKSKNKFKTELPIISEKEFEKTPDIGALILSTNYHINLKDYLRFKAINQTILDIQEEKLYENKFIDHRIQNFKLSHSSINTYLECPQRFYFEKIISIPFETSLAMTAGNFYHAVLEEYFKQIKLDNSLKTLEHLLQIARNEVYRYRNFMTEYEFKDIQKALETNLPILYRDYLSGLQNYNYGIEESFEMKIGDAIITGKLDKWDSIQNEITISDFKTGKKSNAKKKQSLKPYGQTRISDENNPTVDEIYGGNYWRQSVLYQMLAKTKFSQQEIKEMEFIFIIPEDNKIENEKFSMTDEDEQYMKNLILSVHRKIKNKEFEGCKKVDCPWCKGIALRQEHQLISI